MRRDAPIMGYKTTIIAASVAALTIFGSWKAGAGPDHGDKRGNAAIVRKEAALDPLPAAALGPELCNRYRVLEDYAAKRGLDPKLVRAVAIAESSLDPCAVSRVAKAPGQGCYKMGYDFVPDPDSVCNSAFESPAQPDGAPLWRYCGLGLMQTMEPPYTFWTSSLSPDGKTGAYNYGASKRQQLFLEAQLNGRLSFLEDARACSPRFNPFNAEHSACLGTYKLADAMGRAGKLVDGMGQPGTRETMTAYLALHDYHGDGGDAQGWITEFSRRRQYTREFCGRKDAKKDPVCAERRISARPECYGTGDFVAFVRGCVFRQKQPGDAAPFYGDYGSKVLSIAKALEEACKGR